MEEIKKVEILIKGEILDFLNRTIEVLKLPTNFVPILKKTYIFIKYPPSNTSQKVIISAQWNGEIDANNGMYVFREVK